MSQAPKISKSDDFTLVWNIHPHLLPLFFKAVATVTKQKSSPVASSSKGKDILQQHKCVPFFCRFHNSFTFFFLASLANFITTSDAKLITHTHDIISNPIMADFTTDNAQDPAHYQTAVPSEIATLFHRLRVSLLLLDTLMESYVDSTREFLSFCSILTVVISCFEYYQSSSFFFHFLITSSIIFYSRNVIAIC